MAGDVGGVHLVRTGEDDAAVDTLAALLGGRVGLAGVLADLDLRGRRTWAPGLRVRRAFTWAAEDRRTDRWWPQGVSGSADADDSGRVAGRRLLAVSWYARETGDGAELGSRVTVVDLDTLAYRHVLLVAPELDEGGALRVRPLRVHAGGILWRGDHLHVAATRRGIVTCRLSDLVRVPDHLSPGTGAAGLGPLAASGHRYLLPVRFGYEARAADGEERLRYSFLSLDRSTDPPGLLAGEYGRGDQTRRLVHYSLDATGALDTGEDGVARPLSLADAGLRGMQGAVWAGSAYQVTVSHGPWVPGSLYVGRPGAFRRRRWAAPMGPEDVAWSPGDDLLWSVSEHPRRRWVYALARG